MQQLSTCGKRATTLNVARLQGACTPIQYGPSPIEASSSYAENEWTSLDLFEVSSGANDNDMKETKPPAEVTKKKKLKKKYSSSKKANDVVDKKETKSNIAEKSTPNSPHHTVSTVSATGKLASKAQ